MTIGETSPYRLLTPEVANEKRTVVRNAAVDVNMARLPVKTSSAATKALAKLRMVAAMDDFEGCPRSSHALPWRLEIRAQW